MPSLTGYSPELDYSYAPGIFPSMECLLHRPEQVRRLLIHSAAEGREGIVKLTALAVMAAMLLTGCLGLPGGDAVEPDEPQETQPRISLLPT